MAFKVLENLKILLIAHIRRHETRTREKTSVSLVFEWTLVSFHLFRIFRCGANGHFFGEPVVTRNTNSCEYVHTLVRSLVRSLVTTLRDRTTLILSPVEALFQRGLNG